MKANLLESYRLTKAFDLMVVVSPALSTLGGEVLDVVARRALFCRRVVVSGGCIR
ncbi:hypothetical protein Hanom_Chr09g00801481 [Helianthus anomalus]